MLLVDEPTVNLDTDTGESVLAEFGRVKEEGVAVIAVTHDPLVEEYADRVVELTDGVLVGEGVDEATSVDGALGDRDSGSPLALGEQ